ncbi:16S rRNA (guanine(527)-N(7))-methyltransferase RsmG [Nonlabens tegetincola]|uniref:16S rRNA (guanine(527)-N(7))-methyltransferase RsmG n=1 Tax=Nonlabens tegetincola TaxID=323273 RepID=UPI000A202635|nr:16S rRNA (guanine(527)-N(7))-methyltransferase RsmG [Nonlabens tegetincola]ARN70265.1 16S rRNA (guanine(527)-N(7))-methyltransferase RsmG [Nonlabens tegetincola]
MAQIIKDYFPHITDEQFSQFQALESLYKEWNSQINVISRKDIDELYTRHVLHSLGIVSVVRFRESLPNTPGGTRVLDVGTGGGFPGIPLAIMFPKTKFYLIDAIGKKIKVVNAVVEALGLQNVTTEHGRAEKVKGRFDFVVSRAVTNMPDFVKWTRNKIRKDSYHSIENGILYLKGGDLTKELKPFPNAYQYNLDEVFEDEFFETKKVVHLPL